MMPLPIVQPYTVETPVRRASVFSPTRLCRASLRLLCRGVRVELPAGADRLLWMDDRESEEPGYSNWRVAAMWRSFNR